MDWLQISIYTTSEGIEPVSGRLYNLGITGIEIEDYEDFCDFLENNKQYWDYVDDELIEEKKQETRVKVYVSDNASGAEMLAGIRSTLQELKSYDTDGLFGRLELSIDNINEEDWANNWKQYFHPLKIGDRLLIQPEWEPVTEETDRMIFSVNPGMTFGTGSHYTTRLCLEVLEKIVKPGTVMADMGCGSGILSVISLMLGASHATAVDIDPNAVHIALDNAKRNGVDTKNYRVLAGNILTDEKLLLEIADRQYDVIAANIVADVIIAFAPVVAPMLKDDGVFVTSGIIEDRKEDVKEALISAGFEIEEIKQDKDWLCMVCKK